MLIVDETGFLKQGTHSCGVARHYTGTAGTTSNAQVGVFLAFASAKGAAFIDRALYLPRSWTRDPERRAATHVPTGLRLATKLTLAKRMLAHAGPCWPVPAPPTCQPGESSPKPASSPTDVGSGRSN